MNEHLTKRQIDDFRARKLSPFELFAAGEHLAGCAECRAALEFSSLLGTETGFLKTGLERAARFPEHLTFEQLSELVDGNLNEIDREIAESHLSICPVCEREAVELRAFAGELKAEKTPPVAVAEPSFREKIRAFIFTPAFGTAFGAVVLLAIFGGYFLLREDPGPAIVRIEPTPPPVAPVNNGNDAATPPEPRVANANTAGNELQTPPAKDEKTVPGAPLPTAESEILRAGLRNGKLETPRELNDLFARTGNLMGGGFTGGKPFRVETPVRAIIDEKQPVLRWQKFPGADRYRVGVYDENFNEVARVEVETNRLRLSAPLKRGAVYRWEVEALKDGKPLGTAPARTEAEAKFKVLEAGKKARMQKELAKNPGSALWKGIVYARFGLLAEAERELARFARQNPDSKTAQNLLGQIRALRK